MRHQDKEWPQIMKYQLFGYKLEKGMGVIFQTNLKSVRNRRQTKEVHTDLDFAEDIALLSNAIEEA